jgi:MYXO-CTERM domain-containing protein
MGNFSFTGVTAVPEPDAYAWMAAGACLLFAARRRFRG